ncbi:MAG TPA: nucleotide exchange factor GrpE [Ilumatobacteraceae bacterium]|jgi:molecular chaperone GrpE
MSDATPQPSSSAAGPGTESSETDAPPTEGRPVDATEAPLDDPIDEPVEPAATELELLAKDRDEWMDRAQRIAADFENYRRRLATQKADDIDRATGRLAEALLPVLDACEAAFLQHPAEIEPLFNLMLSELKKQGLESMNLHEQPFDPHLADAVLHEPGEGEPIVSEVLRSGYTWNGKVLRPAMVKVRG